MGSIKYAPEQHVMGSGFPPAHYHPTDHTTMKKYTPLEEKRYDVTNTFDQICGVIFCPCRGLQKDTLILSDYEVIYLQKNLLCKSRSRRPYAHMAYLEEVESCGCKTMRSTLTGEPVPGAKAKDQPRGVSPGFFGENVPQIIAEIRRRKDIRGGTAQMKKLDRTVEKLGKLLLQTLQYLDSAGYDTSPVKMAMPDVAGVTFVGKNEKIDVSDCCGPIGCNTRYLRLEPEEVVLEINDCAMCPWGTQRTIRREYNDMDSVEKIKDCGCCFAFKSALGGGMRIQPGIPCANKVKVASTVAKLRERLSTRGQSGQMRRSVKLLQLLAELEKFVKIAVENSQGAVSFPPVTPQEMMKRVDTSDSKVHPTQEKKLENIARLLSETLGSSRQPIDIKALTKTFPKETVNATDKCESCSGMLCTLGVAGWGNVDVDFEEDDLFIRGKDRLGDGDAKIPYGEIDSVDIQRNCFVFYSVNDFSPGWAGWKGKEEVEKLAEKLELRKKYRGQIAQRAHLKDGALSSLWLDLQLESLCVSKGVNWMDFEAVKNTYMTMNGTNPAPQQQIPIPAMATEGKPLVNLDMVTFDPEPFSDSTYVM